MITNLNQKNSLSQTIEQLAIFWEQQKPKLLISAIVAIGTTGFLYLSTQTVPSSPRCTEVVPNPPFESHSVYNQSFQNFLKGTEMEALLDRLVPVHTNFPLAIRFPDYSFPRTMSFYKPSPRLQKQKSSQKSMDVNDLITGFVQGFFSPLTPTLPLIQNVVKELIKGFTNIKQFNEYWGHWITHQLIVPAVQNRAYVVLSLITDDLQMIFNIFFKTLTEITCQYTSSTLPLRHSQKTNTYLAWVQDYFADTIEYKNEFLRFILTGTTKEQSLVTRFVLESWQLNTEVHKIGTSLLGLFRRDKGSIGNYVWSVFDSLAVQTALLYSYKLLVVNVLRTCSESPPLSIIGFF